MQKAVTETMPPIDMDFNDIPPPPVLTRQAAITQEEVDSMLDTDEAMTVRYLQYDCKYRACKYPDVTWGGLVMQDYPHFIELMSTEVPLDSNTFLALKSRVRPEHMGTVLESVRTRDTPEGKEKSQKEFLDMKCTHRGRMGGKSWRDIRRDDYSYFVWAVGNTMTRDTKTFKVLSSCLDKVGTSIVTMTPKGQVKVQRT
jgi:hypothetical protein